MITLASSSSWALVTTLEVSRWPTSPNKVMHLFAKCAMKNTSDVETVWPSGFSMPSRQHSGRNAPDVSYACCQ
eukprot:3327103-Prymnesium_polylepis.1